MENQSSKRVPSRYRYMAGILEGLRALGGKAETGQIYDWLIAEQVAYPNDLTIIQSDGGTRFHKEVRWARKELFDAGLIDAPNRGIWALTSVGMATHLTPDDARIIVSTRAIARRQAKLQSPLAKESEPVPDRSQPERGSGFLIGPTTGPVPSTWTGEITRSIGSPTWTYLMRFGERDVWKIGHAVDVTARLADLNRHVPTEVLREGWTIAASKAWPDALQAYQMEQDFLGKMSAYRSIGERLTCGPDIILAVWNSFSLNKENSDQS